MKPGEGIPWVSYKAHDANLEAERVMLDMQYCTRVVPIKHIKDKDDHFYAQHSNGKKVFWVFADEVMAKMSLRGAWNHTPKKHPLTSTPHEQIPPLFPVACPPFEATDHKTCCHPHPDQ